MPGTDPLTEELQEIVQTCVPELGKLTGGQSPLDASEFGLKWTLEWVQFEPESSTRVVLMPSLIPSPEPGPMTGRLSA